MSKNNLKWLFNTDQGNRWLLFLIYILAVTISMVLVTRSVYGLIHFEDETEYWQFAQNLVAGSFDKIFTTSLIIPPFYPLSIAPAFFLPKNLIYSAVLLLDNLYLTSIIFPVYILLKRLTSNNLLSVVGSAIILCQPLFFINAQLVMSENLYLPLFMWTILLCFMPIFPRREPNATEKPRWIETILLGLLIGISYLTRYISLPLIPIFLIIWWIRPFNKENKWGYSREKLIHLIVMTSEIILLIAIWVLIGKAFHLSKSQLLGFTVTAPPVAAQLSKKRLLLWTIYYLTATVIIAAPVVSLLISGLFKFDFKNWRDAKYRWLISVLLITGITLATTIYHSWAAPYNYPAPTKLQWRYLMIFSVLFLITAMTVLVSFPDHYKKLKLNILIFTLSVLALAASFSLQMTTIKMMHMTTGEEIILRYGNEFLFISIAILIQLIIFIPWKKVPSLGPIALSLGFCVIYLSAFPNIYSALETKQAVINIPVSMILNKVSAERGPIDYNTHFIVIYNPKNVLTSYRRVGEALMVRGYFNIEYITGDDAKSYYSNTKTQYLIMKIDEENQPEKEFIINLDTKNKISGQNFGYSLLETK